jgi:micrococcal nuclease
MFNIAITILSIIGCATPASHTINNVGTVVNVIDGDTINVNVNNITKHVRLIGIDTPETKHPTKTIGCYGKEANAYMVKLLPKGTQISLVLDKETTDKYGRVLAYVYIKSNNLFVNLNLVAKGYAKVMTFKPNVLHKYEFIQAQTKAKTNQVGLWDKCK